MGPSLGQSFVITTIKEEKKVKEMEEFSSPVMLIRKKTTNITLLAKMNLLAFGRVKIFGMLKRRDKSLVDSTWSPSLTHNGQLIQPQATG